jgi:hypothetical protein
LKPSGHYTTKIAQQEVIELHKLKIMVESKGEKITGLNNDAIA